MEVEAAVEQDWATCGERTKNFFSNHWKGLVVFFVPLLSLPIMLINNTPEYRCMYLLLVMAVFWVTEALPLYVTSMIPIVAFPVMGIMSSDQTCRLYFKDTLVMFMGGIMVALAIEYCNLHKRLALRVIQIVGCSPRRLHFGLIFVCMFLSMWISNAACTAMMCPIIQAVLEELQAQGLCKMTREPEYRIVGKKNNEDEPPYPSKVALCYFLGIAYASSMGGCGTVIGTATNLTFKGIYESRFPKSTETLDFPTFMFYSVPSMLVYTILMFLFLQWHFMGLFRPKSKEAEEVRLGQDGADVARKVIDQRYKELGPMSAHEIQVMILFIFMVIMYFTRKPGIFPGWADWLNTKDIRNSMPTIFVVIMCFVLPANYAFMKYFACRKTTGPLPSTTIPSLITWKFIQTKVPWGLIFLLGGGFALAEGSKVSGMATLLGNSLVGLKVLPHTVLLFVVVIVAVFMTAFSSNVAIANIIVPVLAEMSLAIEIHPLYLILPAGLACSMAFHLPVSTPPNALVAGYANIRTKDMAIAGIGPTIISIIVLFVFCQTWGLIVYPNLNTFPEWARQSIVNASV